MNIKKEIKETIKRELIFTGASIAVSVGFKGLQLGYGLLKTRYNNKKVKENIIEEDEDKDVRTILRK